MPTVVSAVPSTPPAGGTAAAHGCTARVQKDCASLARVCVARGRPKAVEGKDKRGH